VDSNHRPPGPEPEFGLIATPLGICHFQVIHHMSVARCLWKSVEAFEALVLSSSQNHLHRVRVFLAADAGPKLARLGADVGL
jgi:hypothetical protein